MQPAVAAALLSFVLQSPNGRNEIAVDYDANTGVVTYRISRDGKPVISPTPISISSGGKRLPAAGAKAFESGSERIDTVEPIVPTFAAKLSDAYKGKAIHFDDRTLLELRAY